MSNFQIHTDYGNTAIEFITFSDGSETCRIREDMIGDTSYVSVDVAVENATRDLVRIMLVKDAIDRFMLRDVRVYLAIGYMPQARADRVFESGMPHPLKVFATAINALNFDEVFIDDPHSDVTSALLNNVNICDQTSSLCYRLTQIERDFSSKFVLCAPDIGAAKKIFDTVQALEHETYIQAEKIRDVKTGNIVRCVVPTEGVEGRDILIVDDIADGGASFKFLAQRLKEAGARKVGLFVTHGIFAKGLQELRADIDYIICNNIVGDYVTVQDFIDFNGED